MPGNDPFKAGSESIYPALSADPSEGASKNAWRFDSPARIAVLGAGPIGLEAALYARYLGYQVDVYERGAVAENLLNWGHVRMFSPFALNSSPLAIRALHAQDPGFDFPANDALLTGREFAESFLIPLARTDLLAGHIQERTEVVSVGREELNKSDLVGDPRAGRTRFPALAPRRRRQ